MKRLLLIALVLLGLSFAAAAQELLAYRDSVKSGYPFLLCLPEDYDAADTVARKPPLIVFLHGRSRCGRDLNMVTKYGMSDNIGVINYDENEEDVFIGYDISHSKKHSEYMAGEIDREVKMIIDKCYTKAKEIILKYEDVLHSSASLLIEKEKIGREEFEALFEGHDIFEDVEVDI